MIGPCRKYLFYMHALAGGGAERVFAILASEFARLGHEVCFVVDFDAPENRGFLSPGIRLEVLPAGHARAVMALSALIRGERPDVTFSGLGVSNLKHMAAAILAGRARRAVITYHGFFPSEPERLSRLGNRLTPVLTRVCGRAIAVSDGLLSALVRDHGADPRRMERIYNPVDALGAPERLTARQLAAREPVILFVGRFAPDKDIPTLLRAFSRTTHPGAILELVGDGSARPEAERLAAELGIASRVRFRGYVADPAPFYLVARCLAIASRRESFGNVVAEALAHGLPVVTTASVGPCEIVDHGRFGVIVPCGDADAMAKALDAVLAEPGDPGPRMARGREFSVFRAADAYLTMAERVIAADR